MNEVDREVERLLALAKADSKVDWSRDRADRVMRALDTKAALQGEGGVPTSSVRYFRYFRRWPLMVAALAACTLLGVHMASVSAPAPWRSAPVKRSAPVDAAQLGPALERLTGLRRQLESGDHEGALAELERPIQPGDEYFEAERERVRTRALCASQRVDRPSVSQCSQAARGVLLSRGVASYGSDHNQGTAK